eukprot:829123-Rhodomonas_salina.1
MQSLSTSFTPAERARAKAALDSTIARLFAISAMEEVASGRDRSGQLCDSPTIRKPDIEQVDEVRKLLHRCHSASPEPKPETLMFSRLPASFPASAALPTRTVCEAPPTRMSSTCPQHPKIDEGGRGTSFVHRGRETAQVFFRAASMPEIEAATGATLLSNVEEARVKHAVRTFSCE